MRSETEVGSKEKGGRETPPPLVYRLEQVEAVVGLRRTAIEERMKLDDFPRPIWLGPKVRGWLVSEIEEWLESRRQQREAGIRPKSLKAEARVDV